MAVTMVFHEHRWISKWGVRRTKHLLTKHCRFNILGQNANFYSLVIKSWMPKWGFHSVNLLGTQAGAWLHRSMVHTHTQQQYDALPVCSVSMAVRKKSYSGNEGQRSQRHTCHLRGKTTTNLRALCYWYSTTIIFTEYRQNYHVFLLIQENFGTHWLHGCEVAIEMAPSERFLIKH